MFSDRKTALLSLYTDIEAQNKRYDDLVEFFERRSQAKTARFFFSASGRIEICGNHTDHQNGCVLTAAIEHDAVALAAKNGTDTINIHSKGQKSFSVNLENLYPIKFERGKSAGMVRGIAAKLKAMGITVSGVDICIDSNVATGSGISSSAAFEVLITKILDFFFNDCRLSSYDLAEISQFSEREYFGKPCGLMDQMASASGGCIMIDFGKSPACVTPIDMSCATGDMSIMLVHTGGSHARLTKEYASIVTEMCRVAEFFGVNTLSEVAESLFMEKIPQIRESLGERCVLRALHFFEENRRVKAISSALMRGDKDAFLSAVNESGDSSTLLLQNVYVDHIQNKSVALALALTKRFFKDEGINGACRIHGGGFVGTIIAFVPTENKMPYIEHMEAVFGKGSVDTIIIRNSGAAVLYEEK